MPFAHVRRTLPPEEPLALQELTQVTSTAACKGDIDLVRLLLMSFHPHIPVVYLTVTNNTGGGQPVSMQNIREVAQLVHGYDIPLFLDACRFAEQVQDFGTSIRQRGLPVLMPAGGHTVYLDINKFFADTAMQPADFGGVALTAILLAAYGYRVVEVGNFACVKVDSPTGQQTFPEVNFVRFAIPRLRYEREDLEAVAEALHLLYERRRECRPSLLPITRTYACAISKRALHSAHRREDTTYESTAGSTDAHCVRDALPAVSGHRATVGPRTSCSLCGQRDQCGTRGRRAGPTHRLCIEDRPRTPVS
jgi:hypothetical protein